ncbi:MAG: endonuclease/exonuclease/phosphatase family protein [Akkermansiaceae bacterium]|nr:endonuclease/exonuclease/phosphatase family protein [Akkermansiaceae bacterium]
MKLPSKWARQMGFFGWLWIWAVIGFLGNAGCQRGRSLGVAKAVPVREDGVLELQLMSFNVRYENSAELGDRSWHQRVIGSVGMIQKERPNIFGVQEAMHGQVADLWASLTEYEFYGVGRDDGKINGEYSGIFYQQDRFQSSLTEKGVFWLSDTPEIPGSRTWGNEIPRIATWMRLVDRMTGRGFYVFNTHLDHKNQASREKAALLIAQRIDGRKHQNEPVILLGDFNATESNAAMAYLTGKKVSIAGKTTAWPNGLTDSYQSLHAKEKNRRTLHFWGNSREGLLKVDHILASKGAEIVSSEIVSGDKPMVSDHFPVTARVRFSR